MDVKGLSLIIVIFLVLIGLYLLSLLLLFISVSRFASYWDSNNKQAKPKNALVYVALGDSAAQSIGAISPNGGYVGQFAKRLEAKHNRPVQIINLSKSGARIKDVTNDQIPLLKNYNPDVVTLDIGGNDIANFNEVKFKSEFAELITMLPTNTLVAEVPFFGGRTQLPFFGSGAAEKSVLAANNIIRDIAEGAPIELVPLHDITKQHNGRRIWNYAPDYFHPSNLGYRAWTDAFWNSYNVIKYKHE